MATKQILVLNPGSTTTKISLFENDKELWTDTIRYSREEIVPFARVAEQLDMRFQDVAAKLDEHQVKVGELWAISSRGCTIYPIEGGVYVIDEEMIDEAANNPFIEHACSLGSMIAYRLTANNSVPCFTVDHGLLDEMIPEARITGVKGIERIPIWHPLNQRAVARRLADAMGKRFDEINCIVCHMGGGVSVGAHRKGFSIDVNNALDGDGPMSAERAGSIPNIALINMIFNNGYTRKEAWSRLVANGGLVSHFGTNNLAEIEKKINGGDAQAELTVKGMAYQMSKEIGALAAALKGEVDAIALTGGMAHSKRLTDFITERVSFIAPVKVYPGECEMEALYRGTKRVLEGKENAKHFKKSGKNHRLVD